MVPHTLQTVAKTDPPEDLSEVLTAARAALDQEFQVSERLDAKARGLATQAGQWFAVAQAVSAIAYSTKDAKDWMLYSVAGTALAGAVALGVTFFFCWRVWKVRDEPAVHPRGLQQMRAAALADAEAGSKLVDHYASHLADRRKTNKQRADALETAQWLWFFAVALPLVQLGLALATRLFA